MNMTVHVPTIDDNFKIKSIIVCDEPEASSRVEIDFTDLLPFASLANKKALDLFLISSFVYGIDRFIDRHSYSIDGWSREFNVIFPVYEDKNWENVKNEFEKLLSFLTGDYWKVNFSKNTLLFPESEISDNFKKPFSQVNLFSGGLDSLIGALDFLKNNPTKLVLLVSHFDPHISARQEQKDLRNKLFEKYPNGFDYIPSISVSLNYSSINKEKTFRSRSLLFIGIAVLVGNYKKLPILVPENGTVSLNYPLSSSRRSACSTRTTYPRFLEGIQNLLTIMGISTSINNSYDLMTKGEMVNACKDLDFLRSNVKISKSCGKGGHVSNWTHKDRNHCGVCMPCIYRQAALQDFVDTTEYGNSINKNRTGRNNQTPFLLSKQGQDFNACLNFLKRELSDTDIRTELLVNGIKQLDKLDQYVELIKRSRAELTKWINKTGNNSLKNE